MTDAHSGSVLQVYYKKRDYWPFVWCVRYISPHLASHVEQVGSPVSDVRVGSVHGDCEFTMQNTFYCVP